MEKEKEKIEEIKLLQEQRRALGNGVAVVIYDPDNNTTTCLLPIPIRDSYFQYSIFWFVLWTLNTTEPPRIVHFGGIKKGEEKNGK